MAIVITDSYMSTGAMFGAPSQALQNYIQGTVQRFVEYTAPVAQHVADSAQRIWHDVTHGATARRTEALRQKLISIWQPNAIIKLADIGAVQQAPDHMVRWIMAHEQLQQMYHNQEIEGYGERYVATTPFYGTGVDNYDYRLVTTGRMVTFEDDEGEKRYAVRNFFELAQLQEANRLTDTEKNAIMHCWAMIDDSLANDMTDPTSEWNKMIG